MCLSRQASAYGAGPQCQREWRHRWSEKGNESGDLCMDAYRRKHSMLVRSLVLNRNAE